MNLLLRSGRRFFTRHAGQLLLALFGIGLGVAVVVALDLISASADRSFAQATDAVLGRATHRIAGGTRGIPDAVYVRLRMEAGFRRSAPVVEGTALVRHPTGDRVLTVLGVDPLAEGGLRDHLSFTDDAQGLDLGALLGRPGAVVLAGSTASALGVRPGGTFELRVSGVPREVHLAGTLDNRDPAVRAGLAGLLVADIATAQELLDRVGRLDRIDLRLTEAEVERLRAWLPEDLRLEPTGARRGALTEITRAFRTNLRALGYLALLVGAFLIYNTVSFAVVQRRGHFGILRALGATGGQVLRAVLLEAAALGVLGVALGIGMGMLLARGLLDVVGRTINDHYASVRVTDVPLDPATLATAAALGVATCLAAAVLPGLEAVRASPREVLQRTALEGRVRRGLPRLCLLGTALGAAGAAVLGLSERDLTAAWLGLFGVVLAAALWTPAVTAGLLRLARPALHALLGVPGDLAARGARAALSRTAVAVTALMLAVAATVGLGAMIGSFRTTVARWLGDALRADVYVSVQTGGADDPATRLDPAVVELLRTTEGVEEAATYRWSTRRSARGEVRVVAVQENPRILAGFDLIEGDGEAAWRAFGSGAAALVSEPFAWRLGLGAGSELVLDTDRGRKALPIAGVFRDFASERGHVMLPRALYDRWFDDPFATSMAILARAGTDVDALVQRLGRRVEGRQDLRIRSDRTLRESSLAIFDRTFAITEALRALCTLVAFLGVWSALMALQLERRREVGVLRALGATRGQVARLLLAQSGLLGACAGLCALPVGALLAWLMVGVINKRSFGWTILDLSVSATSLLQAVGIAVAAALLAALYPAWSTSRAQPAPALREE